MTYNYFFIVNTSLFVLLSTTLIVKAVLYVTFQKNVDRLAFFYPSIEMTSIQPLDVVRKRQNNLTRVAIVTSSILLLLSIVGIILGK